MLIFFSVFIGFILSACSIKTAKLNKDHSGDVIAFSVRMTNIYLIKSGDEYVMIDTGYEGDELKIEKKLSAFNVDPSKISFIVLTHAHADHAGNARYFKDKYGAEIIIGQLDAKNLLNGENGEICPTSVIARVFKWFAPKSFPGVIADYLVSDSMNLHDHGFPMDIYQIGGHTPGSVYMVYKDIVFIGDQIKGTSLNPGRVSRHYYICDLDSNNNDIRTVLEKHPSAFWLTGHFGVLENARIQDWITKQ